MGWDWVSSFSKEVFWVTRGGEKEFEQPMAMRPTSETAMYTMFSKWVQSIRDLPLKVHQTCCVYRYETKSTLPLIRAREIFWNEVCLSWRVGWVLWVSSAFNSPFFFFYFIFLSRWGEWVHCRHTLAMPPLRMPWRHWKMRGGLTCGCWRIRWGCTAYVCDAPCGTSLPERSTPMFWMSHCPVARFFPLLCSTGSRPPALLSASVLCTISLHPPPYSLCVLCFAF